MTGVPRRVCPGYVTCGDCSTSIAARAYQALERWQWQARGMDVRAELADASTGMAPGRIAAFGCGATVPASWPPDGALIDFDSDLLARAGAERPGAPRVHAIGIHTPYPDEYFDRVVISSRLAGLWDQHGELLLAEARRIGREVHVPLLHLAR
ncbi:class I SAM-dependent methyltransferase [Natronosporangium hydrolyticum]|uniref:class I SAM-dependent methyltransferase n=1 Tax=Natronosporangium hydrolyticum TaxID=2811111 RepID=UPI001EFA1719|nr:class I SAM-dependent methyltransferase [Natronosporangium hydrolyticum]